MLESKCLCFTYCNLGLATKIAQIKVPIIKIDVLAALSPGTTDTRIARAKTGKPSHNPHCFMICLPSIGYLSIRPDLVLLCIDS